MQEKAKSVQEALASLEYNRVARIREEAAEQNRAYQALLQMNVQHTEFNRLLGLGNELLQQRAGTGECAVTAATGHTWMINSRVP